MDYNQPIVRVVALKLPLVQVAGERGTGWVHQDCVEPVADPPPTWLERLAGPDVL